MRFAIFLACLCLMAVVWMDVIVVTHAHAAKSILTVGARQ